jgi:flagellar M-ring protein FliF
MEENYSMFNGFSRRSTITMLLAAVILAVILGCVAYWLFNKEYQPLFIDLEPKDSAEIIKQLDALKAEYRINSANGNVEVPVSEVHGTRLKLMGSDISLQGGVGYEIFDNSEFGMTEFAQKINFQRALEGELQRTIMSLQQVKQARVHLVMPERSLFREQKEVPTASITLIMKKDKVLNAAQISGIQRLVASSVPELKENMVTISDQKGVTITQAMPMDESVQIIPWRLRQKMDIEDYLVEKVERVLSHAFVDGQVFVSIDVIINFDQIKKMEEQVIPLEGKQGISRQKESTYNNVDKKNSQNTVRETEYKMGRSVSEIVESPGEIQRINVGILMPSSLSSTEKEQVKKLVEVTIGVDYSRGDDVAIYSSLVKPSSIFDVNDVSEAVENEMSNVEMPNSIDEPQVIALEAKAQYFTIFDDIKYEYLVYALCGTIFLLFVIFVLWVRAKKNKTSHSLTNVEREQLLMQLQHWLSETK